MNREFMALVEDLRVEWGKPLIPTSAERCSTWNTKVGGAPNSMHLQGKAIDFFFLDHKEMREFVELAEKFRFHGIGHGRGLVHLDGRKYGYARWEY